MIPLTAADIALATGGTLVSGDPQTRIDCVGTDTRAMKPNSLFIALKGDTFDGHDKLDDALAGGARILLIHDPARATQHAAVLVDDTRLAMGRLANFVRQRFTKTRVIAVAGSNGKTGTKHLIHSVLATKLKGTMSPKSFNNDIGVPITLFGVAPDDDFVVVEIGTNHPGEVSHLARMCEPDVAIITSIGEEHMEFFKTLDGVRDENASIVDGLRPGGLVLINGDDVRLHDRLPNAMRFGFDDHNDLYAYEIRSTLEGTRFRALTHQDRTGVRGLSDVAPLDATDASSAYPNPEGEGAEYTIPQVGHHNASNALVAIAVGQHLRLTDDAIRTGLAGATSPEMRMQTLRIGSITLINDAYNANPTSVRAALNTIEQIDWSGRKILVLGEMRELGDASRDAHSKIRALATSLAPSRVYFVGTAYQHDDDPNWFADAASAAPNIADHLRDNDLVLIKGSRSMKMEQVQRAIEARFAKPTH